MATGSFIQPDFVGYSAPLAVSAGGTSSSSGLSGSSIMVSNGSAVVQGSAGTSTTLLHGNASGVPTYSAVSLTNDTTGTLPISKGGSNSGTALSGSSIMVSNGSAVVQGSAGTSTTLLHGNAAGAPTYSAVSLTNDTTGTLPISKGGSNSSTALSGSSIMVSNGSAVIQGSAGTSTQVLHGAVAGVPTYSAVGLTTDVSGILPVANGGSNSSTALSGSSIMVSNGSAVIQGSAGTSTQVLHGAAAGVPTYSAVDLTTDVTGTLPVANGGSGRSTLTSNAILTGNGTSAVGQLTPVNNAAVSYTGAGVLQATTTLPSAVQANITSVGTVTSGTWQGTAVTAANGGTGRTTLTSNAVLTGNGTSAVGQLAPVNDAVVSYTGAGVLQATTTIPTAVQNNITTVGNILTGIWEATKISTLQGGTNQTSYTNGQILIGNSSTGLTKTTLTAGTGITVTNGDGSITVTNSVPAHKFWVFEDRKTSGTNGGNSVSGSQTRLLNTVFIDGGSDVTLNTGTGVMTFLAGTYIIDAEAPGFGVAHQCVWWGVTVSGVYGYGTTECAVTSCQTKSRVQTKLTLSGTETMRLDQYTSAVVTNGLGKAGSFTSEVYSRVLITKVA